MNQGIEGFWHVGHEVSGCQRHHSALGIFEQDPPVSRDGLVDITDSVFAIFERNGATGCESELIGAKCVFAGIHYFGRMGPGFFYKDLHVVNVLIHISGAAAVVNAVEGQNFGDAFNGKAGLDGHAEPAFDIFEAFHPFVEVEVFDGAVEVVLKFDGFKDFATIDADGAVTEGTAAQHVAGANVFELFRGHVDAETIGIGVDEFGVAKANADMGIAVEVGDVTGQFFGEPEIVAVDEGDVVAGGVANAGVAGAGRTAVFLVDDADAIVDELLADFDAAIGRGIINNNDLEIAIGLCEDGLDRCSDILLNAMHRDNHGNFFRFVLRCVLRFVGQNRCS